MINNNRTISNKICLKIRIERIKRNLSQEELSFAAGLSKNGLGRIERAEVSPTITTLEKIADALEIDFLELVDVSKVEL